VISGATWPTSTAASMSSGGIFDLATKEDRLHSIDAEMGSPAFWEDTRRAQDLVRERSDLSRIVTRFGDLAKEAEDLRTFVELAEETGDETVAPEIETGIGRLRGTLDEFELETLLSGPHDAKDAILSIHAGAGGTESQDWAQILLRMYLRWCEQAGFKAEVVDAQPGEEAGIKSATVTVTGGHAYGHLRGEIGVHRLVRISPFDAQKRRHTSFASVSVIPEIEDVEVTVRDDEIRVDVFRSSGPGGQGVNTADSAVRITHVPTGIVVQCQNERSQLRNRDTAMRILKSRLFEIAERKQREELDELTGEKKEIAFGSQIRSYTFQPYQLIKDHRTGVEIGNVNAVLDGGLDPFIKGYLLWARGREA
jgi:peptide chain release factor 2